MYHLVRVCKPGVNAHPYLPRTSIWERLESSKIRNCGGIQTERIKELCHYPPLSHYVSPLPTCCPFGLSWILQRQFSFNKKKIVDEGRLSTQNNPIPIAPIHPRTIHPSRLCQLPQLAVNVAVAVELYNRTGVPTVIAAVPSSTPQTTLHPLTSSVRRVNFPKTPVSSDEPTSPPSLPRSRFDVDVLLLKTKSRYWIWK
jgi:hypothetical protein